MENIQDKNRFDCSHCETKGVCLIDNGGSCGSCIKDAKIKNNSKIVVCSVCGGVGINEFKTDRMVKRSPVFIMTIVLVIFYLYCGIELARNNNFEKIFPVISSLTTMIVTFYFSQRNSQ